MKKQFKCPKCNTITSFDGSLSERLIITCPFCGIKGWVTFPEVSPKNSESAIEILHLTKMFGDLAAVDDVSFSVKKGEIFGLLGPNGAGKTTIINMLATLLNPDAGNAKIFGHDVKEEAYIVRQLISVTGQYATLDEKLSATENLTLFALLLGYNRSEAHKKAAELLEFFGLTREANRTVDKFSGGMRRKLDLAASLLNLSPLIFLDEPTTGLDPRTRNQIWGIIRQLVSKGCTILLTTQHLDEADQLADRIAVIDHGRLVAEGTPDELKKSVGVAALHLRLTDAESLDEAMRITQEVLKVKASTSEPTLIIAPMADPERVTDLLIALRKAGIHLVEVTVKKPTLDEAFLALTGESKHEEEVQPNVR